MGSETKTCQNCHNQFIVEPEDFVFYEKMRVPPPTFCPECRMVRRFVFRNERNLFRRKDDVSGKEIFSMYSPEVPVKIYEKDYWWSDAWDATEYARDYDFARPFFEQFRELMYAVPWASRIITNIVNSDYANNAYYLKNCYLCFGIGYSEDSAYAIDGIVKNSFDVTSATNSELCYDGMAVRDCYRTFFSYACEKCHDVWFSRDCVACSDCFGCANLRNKQYYIFNKAYTKEDYEVEIARILDGGSYHANEEAKKMAYAVWQAHPYKYMLSWHNTNVTGDWIVASKNVQHCFNVAELEDSKYCQNVGYVGIGGGKDCYDYTLWGEQAELIYEAVQCGNACRDVKFSWNCWPADQSVEYSVHCHSASDIFGCVGLKKKSYCIFNKQYTKEDYLLLREKIIRHMQTMPYTDAQGRIYSYGEFFPPAFSPFAYNQTIAQDFFPLAKEEAQKEGFIWRDPETHEYQTTIDAAHLPDRIADVQDSILKEIVKCLSCGKAFRIIQMELEFLQRMSLPLPRECPPCRHAARLRLRNIPRFYRRQCQCAGEKSGNGVYQNQTPHTHAADHCPNEFETSYAPDQKEIVYCEECYQAEVV